MKNLLRFFVLSVLFASMFGCAPKSPSCQPPKGEDWMEFTEEAPLKLALSLGDIPVGTILMYPSAEHAFLASIEQADGTTEGPFEYGEIPEGTVRGVNFSIDAGSTYTAEFEVTRCGDRHFIRVKPAAPADGKQA